MEDTQKHAESTQKSGSVNTSAIYPSYRDDGEGGISTHSSIYLQAKTKRLAVGAILQMPKKTNASPLTKLAPVLAALATTTYVTLLHAESFNRGDIQGTPLGVFLSALLSIGGITLVVLFLYIAVLKELHTKDKAYWPPYTNALVIGISIAGCICTSYAFTK